MILIQGTWWLLIGLSLQSLADGRPASTGELVIQAAIPQAIDSVCDRDSGHLLPVLEDLD